MFWSWPIISIVTVLIQSPVSRTPKTVNRTLLYRFVSYRIVLYCVWRTWHDMTWYPVPKALPMSREAYIMRRIVYFIFADLFHVHPVETVYYWFIVGMDERCVCDDPTIRMTKLVEYISMMPRPELYRHVGVDTNPPRYASDCVVQPGLWMEEDTVS